MRNPHGTSKLAGIFKSSKQLRIVDLESRILLPILTSLLFIALTATPAMATNWYVDSSAIGSNKGTSWLNAWTSMTAVSGVAPGDSVYISGGAGSQTYPVNSWNPTGGTSGNPVTYAVGQDTGHNGMVVFDGGGAAFWINSSSNYFTISGNVGGQSHMQIQNYGTCFYDPSSTGVSLLYLTFPNSDDAIELRCSTYYTIDHCTITTSSKADHAITFACANPPILTWGVNKISNNALNLARVNDASGDGADGIQWVTNADISNNTFTGIPVSSYTAGQHQDGIQTGAAYNRIYSNWFENMANTGIFLDEFHNDSNALIYNNVFLISNASLQGDQNGLSILRDGGATGTVTLSNITVANNIFSGFGNDASSLYMNDQSGRGLTIFNTTDQVYNNISCREGWDINSAIKGAGDSSNLGNYPCPTTYFVSYQPLSGSAFSYDFHLTYAANALTAQGVNLSSTFNTDRSGNSRPAAPGAWAIGPYEPAILNGGSAPIAPPNNLHLQ